MPIERSAVESFLYREARLMDAHRYDEWLALWDDDATYWVESRHSEGGRSVVVRRDAHGKVADVTPQPFNARTRVHEYGGRSYTVSGDTIYFANYADQRVYRVPPGAKPEPITPENAMRYADFVVDERRELLLCVREDHGAEH